MKAKLSLAAFFLLISSQNSFASSLCLGDSATDITNGDGKQIGTFEDTKEVYSSVLKSLVDKGYKVVSQSSVKDFPYWTLTK